jgi:ribose transport system substrate-binding protein
MLRKLIPVLVGALVLAACGGGAGQPAKKTIYLSMSYIGNDWQPEAKNMITALAQVPPYNSQVDLHVTVAGTSVERQIAQINEAVQAGAKGILVYPISPTALNATIQRACQAGVKVMTYDSIVTAPCAYGVTIHQHYAGQVTAQWLAEKLHGHGNIVEITGVAGTSVDLYRTEAAEKEFAKYPGIHIIAKAPGDWAQAPAKTAMSNILVSHPASEINGIWAQVGCYSITQLYTERNLPIVPCAGEQTQGHLLYMLPPSQGGVNLSSVSYSATNFTGALGLRELMALLDGQNLPHVIYAQFRLITNDPQPGVSTIPLKVCNQGTPQELANGCDVFASDLGVAPGFFTGIWSPLIGLGLHAALTGNADQDEIRSAQQALQRPAISYDPGLGS